MIAHTEDRQPWPVIFIIPRAFLIAAPQRFGNAGIGLGSVSSSFWRTSANDRPDDILMCSTAIVCDAMQACVMARVKSALF